MSFTQLWERLFIGGIGDAEVLVESNPLDVTTVLTLCPETVPEEVSGINHIYLPVLNNRPIPFGMFDEIIDALWDNLRWRRLLIHSLCGASRSPIIAAAWMQVVGYKNIDAALTDIGRLRMVEPNPILLESVKEAL